MSMKSLCKTPHVIDMTRGRILSHIIIFAFPLFLGNIFQQLYNTADCFIVGRFLGRDSLAAVGSTSQLVLTAIGFFNGLATGAQVVISQSFGAKDKVALKRAIHTALLFSVLIGIFLTFLGIFVSPLVLHLISVPPAIFDLANSYLRIYFSGSSFLILYNMGAGILRALGDSKRPLYFLVFSSVVNIILDSVFVFFLKMGIQGVAFATVISEGISLVPVFWVLFSAEYDYTLRLKDLKIDHEILLKILKIGLPGAVSACLTAFSNTFMQKYVNFFGENCIAGWAIFARFDNLIIMPMMSISFAVTTFVSQNYGAGEFARIKKGVKISFYLNFLMIALLSVLMFAFAPFLSSLFANDSESIRYSSLFIRFTSPFYIFCATTMLFSQALRGFGNSLAPTLITFGGFVVLRQLFLFVSTSFSSSFAFVAIGYPIVWIVTTLVMAVYWLRYSKFLLGISEKNIGQDYKKNV